MANKSSKAEAARRERRLASMRMRARRQRARMRRLDVLLGPEDAAAFERLRAGLEAEGGLDPLTDAETVRVALRRAEAGLS
jgi:hypothetical protein